MPRLSPNISWGDIVANGEYNILDSTISTKQIDPELLARIEKLETAQHMRQYRNCGCKDCANERQTVKW